MTSSKKVNVVIRTDTAEYETYVEARPRADGRWEGALEFRPVRGGESLRTGAQTTQPTPDDIYYWAAGLSITHIENAFSAASAPIKVRPPGVSAAATPPRPEDRLAHLEAIERDVLSMFTSRRTTRLATREIFERGPHANADFVRAFEHLEKRHRLLVRRTVDGVDWLELTLDGANVLGLPAAPAGKAVRDPAKPGR